MKSFFFEQMLFFWILKDLEIKERLSIETCSKLLAIEKKKKEKVTEEICRGTIIFIPNYCL